MVNTGTAWVRGWPAECAAAHLHRQGRSAFPAEMAPGHPWAPEPLCRLRPV